MTTLDHDADSLDAVARILHYPRHRFPGHPFCATIDAPFVGEFLDDFPNVDVLEQIGAFR